MPMPPHGGTLTARVATDAERTRLLTEAAHAPRLTVRDARVIADLELLGVGALSPLDGFMGPEDYHAVVEQMRLANDVPWSLPITLPVSRDEAQPIVPQSLAALTDEAGTVLAVMEVASKFAYDKTREATQVFRTTDAAHPGVARLMAQGDILLGGRVTVLTLPNQQEFPSYRLTPTQTREAFRQRGWQRVVAFQTRNPIHRAHEYLQKCALEMADGLLIHPLVGATKQDDVPPSVRMRCYEVLMDKYYPRDRVVLSVFPAAMRYAGPREALFHAIVRKNYGCTHIIIGRDHAGVGQYYGPLDAQKIFDEFSPEELGITPLRFENSVYCTACEGMASAKTCPHDEARWVSLSGTKLRELLSRGEVPPHEITRPEVAQILIEAMKNKGSDPLLLNSTRNP